MKEYWTCSKFADWLRGTKKPFALGWDEWEEWDADARKAHPFRYWLTEVLLDRIQTIIFWPRTKWRSIDAYIDNRFVNKTHYLKTGLKPGTWADFDYRVLHGLMTELVLYVEVELASMERRGKGPRRSKELGLKHLEWEMGLKWDDHSGTDPSDEHYGKPTHQAISAKETYDLYVWWTETRPKRPDPYADIKSDEIEDKYMYVHEIEEQHEKEDDDMLCRLIRNRRCMWT